MGWLEIEKLFDSLEKRVPFRAFADFYRTLNLQPGRSFGMTKEKFKKEFEKASEKSKKGYYQILKDLLVNYIHYGDKSVRFYPIEQDQAHSLYTSLKNKSLEENSIFSERFPFLLDDDELRTEVDRISLISVDVEKEGVELLFGSSRHYTWHKQLELGSYIRSDKLSEFDLDDDLEMTVKTKKYRQFYDTVYLDLKNNIIQIRLDWSGHLKTSENHTYLSHLSCYVEKLFCEILGTGFKLPEPVDFFPVVGKLYNDRFVGLVCELGYRVDSGSVKLDKWRETEPKDLRLENFHSAGVDAVKGNISPYRIAITWRDMPSGKPLSKPELCVYGTIQCLGHSTRKYPVENALIVNCSNKEEFNYLNHVLLDKSTGYAQ